MPETITAPSPEQGTTHRPDEVTISADKFAGTFFGIDTPKQENTEVQEPPKTETLKTETPKTDTTPPATASTDEEIVDANQWLKNTFGWESEAAAKKEIEELRKAKETNPQELKFENDQSKLIYQYLKDGKTKQVKDFLEKQERINQFTTGDVTEDNAGDVIKLAMKLKYGNLSDSEIEYKYNKQYGLPKELSQTDEESDDEFAGRKSTWQEQVNDIKMNRMIDAKLAMPELEQHKSQLALPDIFSQGVQEKQPTQEELDAADKYNKAFVDSIDATLKNFNGLSVAVKNEVVDFPVNYGTTDEEKTALASVMKDFAKKNYDANALLAELWVNDDGTIKTDQMIEDYYFVKNKKNIVGKIANESASKAIEAYIKGKKNITITQGGSPEVPLLDNDQKSEMDKIRDSVFGK